MLQQLPPLSAMRVFEVVGRAKSFRQAAVELRTTHTAISQRMLQLETWFGVKLVSRSRVGVVLTEDGERLHAHARAAFAMLSHGTAELKTQSPNGTLRIWSVPAFAARWITPRYKSLENAMGGTQLVLRPTEVEVDFNRNQADVEIRFGDRTEPGLLAETLMRPRTIAVASPDWLAANPTARNPNALAEMPLIQAQNDNEWRRWLVAVGVTQVSSIKGPRFWIGTATIEAARLGFGVALVCEPFAIEDLAARRLVRVVDDGAHLEPYTLVVREDRIREKAISNFRRWIKSTLPDAVNV
jgi:LysR family glycine cleavage system transcriptional activator